MPAPSRVQQQCPSRVILRLTVRFASHTQQSECALAPVLGCTRYWVLPCLSFQLTSASPVSSSSTVPSCPFPAARESGLPYPIFDPTSALPASTSVSHVSSVRASSFVLSIKQHRPSSFRSASSRVEQYFQRFQRSIPISSIIEQR